MMSGTSIIANKNYLFNFQVDSVGPIGVDVWSWGIDFLNLAQTELTFKLNIVNFQVDSVGPIGADV